MHFAERRLSVRRDHGALLTVQCDVLSRVVERFFRMLQMEGEVSDSAIENAAEIAGNQRPADRCNEINRQK